MYIYNIYQVIHIYIYIYNDFKNTFIYEKYFLFFTEGTSDKTPIKKAKYF